MKVALVDRICADCRLTKTGRPSTNGPSRGRVRGSTRKCCLEFVPSIVSRGFFLRDGDFRMETDLAAAVLRWAIPCRRGVDRVGIGHMNAAAPRGGGSLTGWPIVTAN